MKDNKLKRFAIDRCMFSINLTQAIIPIKFKCRFFVEIKSFSTQLISKSISKSSDQYRAVKSIVEFNETL